MTTGQSYNQTKWVSSHFNKILVVEVTVVVDNNEEVDYILVVEVTVVVGNKEEVDYILVVNDIIVVDNTNGPS